MVRQSSSLVWSATLVVVLGSGGCSKQTGVSATSKQATTSSKPETTPAERLAKKTPASAPVRPVFPLRVGVPRAAQYVHAMAASADGSTLAAGLNDGAVQLWDLATAKKLVALRGHKSAVRAVAFSPDGAFVASGDTGGRMILWQRDGTKAHTFRDKGNRVHALAFSPNGKLLALGADAQQLVVWGATKPWRKVRDVEVQQESYDSDDDPVGSLVFLSNKRLLAAFSGKVDVLVPRSGKMIASWRTNTQECDYEQQCSGWANATMALSPNRRRVAVGYNNGCVLIHAINGACSVVKPGRLGKGGARALAFTPDSKELVAAGDRGTVRVLQVRGRKLVRELERPMKAAINALLITPDGKLVSAGKEKVARISDLKGEKPTQLAIWPGAVTDPGPLHIEKIIGLAFDTEGKLRSTDTHDVTLRWDLLSGKAEGKAPPASAPLHLYSVGRLGPAQRRVLKGKTLLSRLEDIFDQLTRWRVQQDGGGGCVEGCPADPVVVSSDQGKAGYILRWQLLVTQLQGKRSRQKLPRKKATYVVGFAGKGRWLAVATRKHGVLLHDLTQKAHLSPFAGHSAKVQSVAVSADAKLLATGDVAGKVIVWDISSGSKVKELQPEGGGPSALTFGPAGLLAAAAADRSVTVWKLDLKP